MRYTEKEYEKGYNGLKGWLSVLAALIIVAPLRLLNEISTKIVYLNRKLIQRILNLAAIIAGICTIADIVLSYVLTDVNLWIGKVPLVLQITCTIILVSVSFWFAFYDFVIYKHLSSLLPLDPSKINNEKAPVMETTEEQHVTNEVQSMDNFNSIKTNSFANLEDDIFTELQNLDLPEMDPVVPSMDISELSDKLAATEYNDIGDVKGHIDASIVTGSADITAVQKEEEDVTDGISLDNISALDDELFELLNEDLLDDETTVNFRHNLSEQVENLQAISDEDLKKDMDDSTDPSKYITEDSLFKYLKELGADNFGEFDMFGDYSPSDDFDLFS